MDRIQNAFQNGKAFIGFLTGGDPTIEKTEEFMMEMVRGGVDLIEIGIPFSDPIAEGPIIQAANIRALSNGTDTDSIFTLVENARKKTQIPIVLLTYLNPVFKYGYERFFKRCMEAGIDGLIIPDLPYEEKGEAEEKASKFGIAIISLIAPTSKERIKMIAENAKGFIYAVSSMGVTGIRSEIETDLSTIVKTIQESTDTPVAVGFGIHTKEQAANVAKVADGVIVGSAIAQIIEAHQERAGEYIYAYVKEMKECL